MVWPACVRGRNGDTFATEALAAGVSIFELSRVMGDSVKTIDKHYGHLAHDSEAAIRARLDARAAREWALNRRWAATPTRAPHGAIPLSMRARAVRERRDSNPRPPA